MLGSFNKISVFDTSLAESFRSEILIQNLQKTFIF